MIVTDNLWIVCGIKRCNKGFRLIDNLTTKEEYERIWGLSTALKTKKAHK
jgi:hypothetical protein